MYYLSMLMVIGSSVLYHISAKSITKSLHPLFSMLVTYGTALVLTALLMLVFPMERQTLGPALKNVNWASFMLGAAAVGLEAGYMLVYRTGWNISVASVYSNAAVMLLLIPIGVLVFRERIHLNTVMGILFCMVGIYLINRR